MIHLSDLAKASLASPSHRGGGGAILSRWQALTLRPLLRPFARPREARRRERRGAVDDGGVFSVEMGERERVHVGGVPQPVADAHRRGPAGVGDDEGAIAEIAGVTRRRFKGIVGEDATQNQRRRAESVERLLERGADEGAMRALADDRLAVER